MNATTIYVGNHFVVEAYPWGESTFATGAKAIRNHNSLMVKVPAYRRHHSTTRKDARLFAKSVWGPKAEIGWYHPQENIYDYEGQTIYKAFVVVIVGTAEDFHSAMEDYTHIGIKELAW